MHHFLMVIKKKVCDLFKIKGIIYGAKYDQVKGEISFYKNGTFIGVGFKNLKDLDLYPSFDFLYTNTKIELIDEEEFF
jgi:hypothetical protein